MQTYTEGNVRSFVEEVTGALDSKENYLVELGTANNSVKLLTSSVGNVIGVVRQKLQAGHPDVSIRMLGKDGTFKVVAGGVAAQGDKMIGATGGKAVKLPTTPGRYRVIGRKLTYGNSADGDVIEVSDQPEWVDVASADSLTALTFTAGGATGPEVAALRDAVKAILEAHGIMA